MTELYLGNLNMERFPTLGDNLIGQDLIQATTTHETSTAIACPGDWYTESGLVVARYAHDDFPVMVRTTEVCRKLQDDPQFGLIKAVVQELRCEKVFCHDISEFH